MSVLILSSLLALTTCGPAANGPVVLGASPPDVLYQAYAASGQVGGPFTITGAPMVVLNSSGDAYDYEITSTAAWVSWDVPTRGTIRAGEKLTVTPSIISASTPTSPGNFTADVTLVDASTKELRAGMRVNLTVAAPQPPGSAWQYARIGGGGFVTGGDVADDGTKIFRTDTSGAYLYDDAAGEFVQIVPTHLPPTANVPWNGDGAYEALIAASSPEIIYVAYNNTIWKSTDQGNTFLSVLSGLSFNANGGSMRTKQRHGDIDPADPNHVLIGDQLAMYRTTDGGATWSKVATLPAPGGGGGVPGYSGFAFDRSSELTGGRTSIAMVATNGAFYRTTDGCATWSLVSGSPSAEPLMAEFDDRGNYFASAQGMWRYDGSWKDLCIPSADNVTFALDPDDSSHVVIFRGPYLNFVHTTDRGDTLSGPNWTMLETRSVDGIPWHNRAVGDGGYFHNNAIVDPTRKVVWWSGGNVGIASAPLSRLVVDADPIIDVHGIGIGNLCANVLVAPPGSSKLHVACWDEHYMALDRDNVTYPTMANDTGGLGNSFGLDYSKENPRYLARWLGSSRILQSGWSDDDGSTWHPFAQLPANTASIDDWGAGAILAYSGVNNLIVVTSNTGSSSGVMKVPYYTLDRGSTWHPVDLGTPWTQARLSGLHMAAFLNREIIVADKMVLGRFWLLVYSDDEGFRGIYRTEDGGVSWRRTASLPGGVAVWAWNAHIESPVTNHLWIGGGWEGPHDATGSGGLYFSTDGGMTFGRVPDVNEPAKFGFGAPAAAGGYPVLFLEGYVAGEHGVYMSPNALDAAPTWIRLGDFPNGQPTVPRFIAGDPDVPGRVWVAKGCAGVHFGDFGDRLGVPPAGR